LGEKDITEKTLASYNDVFSDIVNGLLFEGRPVVNPDALADAAPYSMYKTDGKVHEQERDVSKFLISAVFTAISGSLLILWRTGGQILIMCPQIKLLLYIQTRF